MYIYRRMTASELNRQMDAQNMRPPRLPEKCSRCGRDLIATKFEDWGWADNNTNYIFECPMRKILFWHDKTGMNFPLHHPEWDKRILL